MTDPVTDRQEKPDYMLSTYIKCTPAALWTALRDPAQMVNYDFLGQTATLEGDVTVLRAPDGTVTLHTRELEVEPMTRLVTTFEPKWDDVTTPSRIVYLIEEMGDYCRLTVEHYGLNHDPDGGTADGWERSIAGLKTWLETGEPACFGGPELWAEYEEAEA